MKTLLIPAPPYKYALSWAHEVIDHLIAQHARATELVMAAMDISTRDLAKLLAKPDPEWNYVRTRIKYLHTRIVERGYEPDIYTVVEWIYGTRPTGERLNRFTRLDRELKRTRLGEQGLGGTGGG